MPPEADESANIDPQAEEGSGSEKKPPMTSKVTGEVTKSSNEIDRENKARKEKLYEEGKTPQTVAQDLKNEQTEDEDGAENKEEEETPEECEEQELTDEQKQEVEDLVAGNTKDDLLALAKEEKVEGIDESATKAVIAEAIVRKREAGE